MQLALHKNLLDMKEYSDNDFFSRNTNFSELSSSQSYPTN